MSCEKENCCKVETQMKVTAAKKLQREIDEELKKKDKTIASVIKNTEEAKYEDS